MVVAPRKVAGDSFKFFPKKTILNICFECANTDVSDVATKLPFNKVKMSACIIFENVMFQICKKIDHSVAVSIIGNVLMALGFLFEGPIPLLTPLKTSVTSVQISTAVMATGYSMVYVPTFGRAHSAAARNGFDRDPEISLYITSEIYS